MVILSEISIAALFHKEMVIIYRGEVASILKGQFHLGNVCYQWWTYDGLQLY